MTGLDFLRRDSDHYWDSVEDVIEMRGSFHPCHNRLTLGVRLFDGVVEQYRGIQNNHIHYTVI